MRKIDRMPELPEVTRYTKYYDHDGMLRAYANRAMLLAMIFGMLAMGSLGFAMYVRIQPPTVIRVDKDGNALVVGGPRGGKVATISLSADASVGVAPTDLEGRAVICQFLRRYLARSEEHTSELQSRQYLVCRLLLLKKKQRMYCILHG